jgi:hypothetical protein
MKKLNDENPYMKIVGSFFPMVTFENLASMKPLQDILSKLEQEIV